MSSPVLVASATATTGKATVVALSALGVPVRAFVKRIDDARLDSIRALPGVTLVAGDLSVPADVAAALAGVKRALLVTSAFSHDQFDIETDFLVAARAAGVEAVVRISTASMLISAGSTCAYGRAHYAIEHFAVEHGLPLVNLRPNWFQTNLLSSAGEAKATGKMTLPVSGGGHGGAFIDPVDVGTAAAAILTQPSEGLAPFLALRNVEVHGPAVVNFNAVAEALSKAVGYEIKVQQAPVGAWTEVLKSYGIPTTFARAYAQTVLKCDESAAVASAFPSASSPELLKIWAPKNDTTAWANSPLVKAAFAKA